MRKTTAIAAAALGAIGMYLLDPECGTARRATLHARTVHVGHETWGWLRGFTRGLRNKSRGLLMEYLARSLSMPPSDRVLAERVRAEMGHIVRHPHRVSVAADAGWIQLGGEVLVDEREPLLTRLRTLPGIIGIEAHLTERDSLESELESLLPSKTAAARAAS